MLETILNSILALILVLGIIFAFSFFYKKRQKMSSLVEVVAYQTVGQKMAIAVVKIQDELLFLGIGQNDFKLIKKVSIKDRYKSEIVIKGGE